jgi:predicted phage-related endonuclease
MGLTAEQLQARPKTLGASEISAIVGENPYREAADIWARKARGPDLEIPPLIPPEGPRQELPEFGDDEGQIEIDPRDAGNLLEDAIGKLYAKASGFDVVPGGGTMAHQDHPWATATPDFWCFNPPRDVVKAPSHGLECKLVGFGAASDWDADGVPGYVMCQVQWTMFVVGAQRWDVAASIGSRPRFVRVDRDEELIGMLWEAGERFWREHVLADVPPPTETSTGATRLVVARWARDNGQTIVAPDDAVDLVRDLMRYQAAEKEAKDGARQTKAKLCEIVGENKAIKGPWGSFHWGTQRGSVGWKALAEQLAGGEIDPDLLEEFRSEPYRKARLFAKKGWTP